MQVFLFVLFFFLSDVVLSQVVLPITRQNRFDVSMHDEKKHCLYESRLYSEGAIFLVGNVMMVCKDLDKREKITRLGWEILDAEG